MINVTFNPRMRTLCVEGHAGTAPVGQDLLCSAASALGFALEAHCAKHPEYKADIKRAERAGVFWIQMKSRKGIKPLRVIADGYQLLAEFYPCEMKFEERND